MVNNDVEGHFESTNQYNSIDVFNYIVSTILVFTLWTYEPHMKYFFYYT